MRTGLGIEQLTGIYGRIARRYDRQHALITARSDQRGRALLVESAVREGDVVLDCGAGTGSTGILAANHELTSTRLAGFDITRDADRTERLMVLAPALRIFDTVIRVSTI